MGESVPSKDERSPLRQLTEEKLTQLQLFSEEYDERTLERHLMGETKYGAGTWLKVDTLEMAIEEVLDLGNYIRFTYIRLRLLQEQQQTDKSTAAPKPGNEMLGKEAFISGKAGVQ